MDFALSSFPGRLPRTLHYALLLSHNALPHAPRYWFHGLTCFGVSRPPLFLQHLDVLPMQTLPTSQLSLNSFHLPVCTLSLFVSCDCRQPIPSSSTPGMTIHLPDLGAWTTNSDSDLQAFFTFLSFPTTTLLITNPLSWLNTRLLLRNIVIDRFS